MISNAGFLSLSLFHLIIDHHQGISSPDRVLPSSMLSAVPPPDVCVSTRFGKCKERVGKGSRESAANVEVK